LTLTAAALTAAVLRKVRRVKLVMIFKSFLDY
jgi:hypothetical protein